VLTKSNLYFFACALVLLAALSSFHLLPLVVALLVVVFTLALMFFRYCTSTNKTIAAFITWLLVIVLGVAVGLYRPAGFNYPLIFSLNQLHEGGKPFSLYINIAKLLAGYITVYFLLSVGLQAYIKSQTRQYALAIGLGFIIVILAYFALGLGFYLKPLKYVALFGLVNLLVTCVAEEAFMRLLLQAQLQKFLSELASGFWLEAIPLLITTAIFVLLHLSSNLNVLWVFALAGFSYGLVYSLTKNLWACVAVHFTVNILHFSLLTYPLA
jgi:membrane protease YdiL (CAAX protease family)